MSKIKRADWAIQYTNTLLQSLGEPLETGKGQHKRGDAEVPENTLEPLGE